MNINSKRLNRFGIVIFVLFLGLSPKLMHAQYAKQKLNVEGDFYFDSENYREAENYYQQSADLKPDFQSLYNLGVSLEKQDSINSTLQTYQSAISYAENDEARSVAFFNMGNTLLNDQENLTIENLESAIEYYKSAIRYNRNNHPAMHNLAIAQATLDMKKQQEQQQQQQNQQQENQEQQENKEQQENQEQQEQNQQQENQEQNQQNQKEEEKEKQEAQKKEIDKQEIENILKMVEKEDKEVQGKMRKQTKSDNTEKKKKW